MQSRQIFASALAIAVPIVLVLIAVMLLPRPGTSSPSTSPETAPSVKNAPASTTSDQSAPSQSSVSASQARPTAVPKPRPQSSGPAAPDFEGGGAWINSEPLKLADLTSQGKVVLVDFWTYGCYNCQNTLPYVKQWWAKYKDQGLVIVGVHTPEFSHEGVLENVQDAVKREDIGWPIVQDNDYTIWRAYGNNYWPRFYLVDHRGQIIYDHIGEGAYDETDRQIAAALEAAKRQ